MLKIEDVIEDLHNLDVVAFAQLSDTLWKLGNLEDIKEKVTPELFNLHIGINMIGIWKSEGWDCIIAEQADFVPYVSGVLREFELCDVKESFENLKAIAPEKRRELVKSMRQKVNLLNELTGRYWGEATEMAGWKQVFDYIHKNVMK